MKSPTIARPLPVFLLSIYGTGIDEYSLDRHLRRRLRSTKIRSRAWMRTLLSWRRLYRARTLNCVLWRKVSGLSTIYVTALEKLLLTVSSVETEDACRRGCRCGWRKCLDPYVRLRIFESVADFRYASEQIKTAIFGRYFMFHSSSK